jgi:CubicO group peptidase (beta-lactamase class C family)
VLTKATGRDLRDYAQERLFDPIDVEIGSWQRSQEGYRFGGNNFSLTPEGFLRFGQLYERKGRWNGRPVVPSEWVRESTRSHVHDTYHGYPYGYFWWNVNYHGLEVDFAWGHGGQYVFVVPELNLVVATTSNLQSTPQDDGYTESVHELLKNDILPNPRGQN